MLRFTKGVRKVIPSFPLWSNQLTAPPSLVNMHNLQSLQAGTSGKTVVYFPACISRLMGKPPGKSKSILAAFIDVSKKAGVNVITAKNITGSCCGQIFSSKGYADAYRFTASKVIKQLWELSDHGSYPVVTDISSCTYTLKNMRTILAEQDIVLFDKLTIMDSVEYLHDIVLPGIKIKSKKSSIVLHPVCSLHKMGTESVLKHLASHLADQVIVPVHSGCCGMAGDRGFLFPELTASATNEEASEIKELVSEGYYSTTRTCEMALAEATGKNFESILFLADECTA